MHRQREATTALIADQGGWISEKPTNRFRPIFRDPAAPDPSQATVFAFLSREFFGELHPGTRISKADEDPPMNRTSGGRTVRVAAARCFSAPVPFRYGPSRRPCRKYALHTVTW